VGISYYANAGFNHIIVQYCITFSFSNKASFFFFESSQIRIDSTTISVKTNLSLLHSIQNSTLDNFFKFFLLYEQDAYFETKGVLH